MNNIEKNKQLVAVAKILNYFGVKGEVKVKPLGEVPIDKFKKFSTNKGELNVVRKRKGSGHLTIIQFREINSKELATQYKGTILYVDRSELEEVDNVETFYYFDLFGLKAYANDKEIGVVDDVHRLGGIDFLDIKTLDDKVLIPFIEKFVEKVDIKEGKIYLREIDVFLR